MNKNSPLIIAFSGGPDSVFLTEYLLREGYSSLFLVHFNHHMDMRSGANDTDELFCRAYAKEKNLPLKVGHWENPCASEEKARNARYTFLEEVRITEGARYISTGHHKNDQAETVLIQFLRSGGIKSLSGMKEYNDERNLWRPLLDITKGEIFQYLSENNIAYCTDSSNAESVFTRNFIRNDVLPLIEQRFPSVQHHLCVQAEQFASLEKEIDERAEYILQKYPEQGIPVSEISDQLSAVQIALLRMILKNKSVNAGFISEFQKFISSPHNGKKLETQTQVFYISGKLFFWKDKSDIID